MAVAEAADVEQESWLDHQVGKVHFGAGHYAAAAGAFAKALELRVASGAPATAIYSSTVALRRARDLQDSGD